MTPIPCRPPPAPSNGPPFQDRFRDSSCGGLIGVVGDVFCPALQTLPVGTDGDTKPAPGGNPHDPTATHGRGPAVRGGRIRDAEGMYRGLDSAHSLMPT